MIAKGWGTGNCFYLGVDVAVPGSHRFSCRNMGKLAKSSNLQLAFQYTLSNIGKDMTIDVHATATNNIVKLVALTLSCELKINTFSTTTTSTQLWYQSKFTTNIDGNTQGSKMGQW
jgi:hypothetical protein